MIVRQTGVTIVQGVTVRDVLTRSGAVCGVVTDQGTIECEYVVNAAGMWARQLGAKSGHYRDAAPRYSTDPVPRHKPAMMVSATCHGVWRHRYLTTPPSEAAICCPGIGVRRLAL